MVGRCYKPFVSAVSFLFLLFPSVVTSGLRAGRQHFKHEFWLKCLNNTRESICQNF